MQQMIPALLIGLVVFAVLGLLLPRLLRSREAVRTEQILDRMSRAGYDTAAENVQLAQTSDREPEEKLDLTPLGNAFVALPGGRRFYLLMLKAGFSPNMRKVVGGVALFALVLTVLFYPLLKIAAVIPAFALAMYVPILFFRRKITKRNDHFINQFPDAIDMIVRSVKSGQPVSVALRMIADNTEPPIRDEFRQVVNEVAYGRPLVEALRRLATRIDEPDVHFFAVVLAVQQETGGNLAEVLSNLSNVIRGRKRLRLKIKALTSEGRATALILGLLPVVQFLAIKLTSPDYLTPLFTTSLGNIILATAVGLILLAAWITKQLINVDI